MKARNLKLLLCLLVAIIVTPKCNAQHRPILVQGAMEMEMDYFVQSMKHPKKEIYGSYIYYVGKYHGKDLVVSRTVEGLVNASAATSIAIQKYNPRIIINQGTAGGHDPNLHTGDIVVVQKTFNMGSNQTPQKEKGEGTNPEEWEFATTAQRSIVKGEIVDNEYFTSDRKLLHIASKVPYEKGKLVVGVIGSADQWNREIDRINFLHKKFGTSAEEMETSSVAQIAHDFHIPFLGIRILSNTELYHEDFNPQTAHDCQEFVLKVIDKL